jgi:NADPH:quinone reductase
MLAIEVSRHGGPDVLVPVERPTPVPAAGELLVRNRWIGINYVDTQHAAGTPYPVELPMVLGLEAAGTIAATGPDVDHTGPGTRIGDPVVHLGFGGRYAEFTAIPAQQALPIPDDIPLDIAASVTSMGTMAHVLTRVAMNVGPDDVIVVHAAAGGTGGAVVQLAAAAGAEVIAITSTPDKVKAALDLGAKHAFATRDTPDPVAAVMSLTGDLGASIVYDGTGPDTFDASLDMLARYGTLVLYGQASGPLKPFDPSRLSGLTEIGSKSGSLTVRWASGSHYLQAPDDRARAFTAVIQDVRAGHLNPRIVERIPLRHASRAHELLAGRTVTGKILLDVGTDTRVA